MPFCNSCGTEVPAGVKFCPGCGAPVGAGAAPAGAAPGGAPQGAAAADDNQNIIAALGYFIPLVAVIMLFIEPYKNNRFIRFHSFQSIIFNVAFIVLWVVLGVLGTIIGFIPVIQVVAIVLVPVYLLLGLAYFVAWIMLMVKAFQGQEWSLPMVGGYAAKYV